MGQFPMGPLRVPLGPRVNVSMVVKLPEEGCQHGNKWLISVVEDHQLSLLLVVPF